jgi:hypothetical protein
MTCNKEKVEEKWESELRREAEEIFEDRKRKLGLDAILDLEFNKGVWGPPVVGENIYGEAFPFEQPPRVWIEIFTPDVTKKEIKEMVCHELIHIQHPELKKENKKFQSLVRACIELKRKK